MKKAFSRKALQDLFEPVARLLAICAGVALALGLVNLVTDPIIRKAALREKNAVLTKLAGNDIPGQARTAFPLEIIKTTYETVWFPQLKSYADRSLVERCYERSSTGNYFLKRGLPEPDLVSLSGIIEKNAFTFKSRVRAWYLLKTAGEISGYILELEGAGYGGPIDIIAAYETDGTVRSFQVLRAEESPSQTKMIREDAYSRHFPGT